MNIFSKKLIGGIAAMVMVFGINSCVKQEFDQPPTGGTDPHVDGTYITIAALKAGYIANSFTPVTKDYYIKGVVIADDKSGNFYKEMVIQDSTGGISVLMDISNYYTDFPIGRRVFIKCQGLYMNAYNGLIQLGSSIDNSLGYPSLARIPSSLVSKYVLKGTYYHTVVPDTLTLNSLVTATLTYPQNTLVTITDAQFIQGDLTRTWADAAGLNDLSTNIEDCAHNALEIRTSGYSDFAGQVVPSKHGTITGVIQIYSGSLQLKVRDLNDVSMVSPRCGEITNTCLYNDTAGYMPIDSIRLWNTFGNSTCPTNRFIKGIVISDIASDNFDNRNMFIQDSTGAIVVRYPGDHSIPLGSLVEVYVSNQPFSVYHGLLEILVPSTLNCKIKGSCVEVPLIATIAQINANPDAYESKLIRIDNVVFSGIGTSYVDATIISDLTASMKIRTSSYSDFSYESYPAGTVGYITGVLSYYDAPEFYLRNLTDVHP